MKHPYLTSFLLALLPVFAVGIVIASGTPRSAEAQDGPFHCTASSLFFPVSGTVGWTYSDPASTDRDASGNRTVHTGVDIFADGGTGSPVYAPADGVITRPPGANSLNLNLPGVTNLLTGEAGIDVYLTHINHSLSIGQTFVAGQVIATQATDHVHVSVGAFAGYDDREIEQTQDPSPYFSAALNYGANVTQRESAANKCYALAPNAPALPSIAEKTAETPVETFAPQTYIVESGDTLSGIAETFGVTVDELAAANGFSDVDYLSLGQELTIPGGSGSIAATASPDSATAASAPTSGQYTVVGGDTLSSIAAAFGTDVDAIMTANYLSDADFLSIGDVLVIPGANASVGTTTELASTAASAGEYTVVAGDTLSSIAAAFGTDVDAIMTANYLSDADFLSIGDVLQLP